MIEWVIALVLLLLGLAAAGTWFFLSQPPGSRDLPDHLKEFVVDEPARWVAPDLSCGLGNNLFQVAAAKTYGAAWDRTPVVLFKKEHSAVLADVLRITGLRLILEKPGQEVLEPQEFAPLLPADVAGRGAILKGFWQADALANQDFANLVVVAPHDGGRWRKDEQATAILSHKPRGGNGFSTAPLRSRVTCFDDYFTTWNESQVLPVSYASTALAHLDYERLVLFSDDAAWAARAALGGAEFVDIRSGVDTLVAMSMCSAGGVVANSTLSWWGAALGAQKAVMPSPWFRHLPEARLYPAWATVQPVPEWGFLRGTAAHVDTPFYVTPSFDFSIKFVMVDAPFHRAAEWADAAPALSANPFVDAIDALDAVECVALLFADAAPTAPLEQILATVKEYTMQTGWAALTLGEGLVVLNRQCRAWRGVAASSFAPVTLGYMNIAATVKTVAGPPCAVRRAVVPPLVFVHLGPNPFPSYAPLTIGQARAWHPGARTVVFVWPENLRRARRACPGCEVLDASAVDSEALRDFRRNTTLDAAWRGGFWRWTTERLLVLAAWATPDVLPLVHMENDTLLYATREELAPWLGGAASKGLAFAPLAHNQLLSNCLMVTSLDALGRFAAFLAAPKPPGTQQWHNNEMEVTHDFFMRNRDVVAVLPTTPRTATSLVFDAAPYGQFMGGVDARNFGKQAWEARPGFVSDVAAFCVAHDVSIAYRRERGLWRPYVASEHGEYPLACLHMHAKIVEPFLSTRDRKPAVPSVTWRTAERKTCSGCGPKLSTETLKGRLGNKVLQNVVVSALARRFNLRAEYAAHGECDELGIALHSGTRPAAHTAQRVTMRNAMALLRSAEVPDGLLMQDDYQYFQMPDIARMVYEELAPARAATPTRSEGVFVHIRLGDAPPPRPARDWLAAIAALRVDDEPVWMATEDAGHPLSRAIAERFSPSPVDGSTTDIVKFGASFPRMVLSDGTFSWLVAALSRARPADIVWLPRFSSWHGDIFLPEWTRDTGHRLVSGDAFSETADVVVLSAATKAYWTSLQLNSRQALIEDGQAVDGDVVMVCTQDLARAAPLLRSFRILVLHNSDDTAPQRDIVALLDRMPAARVFCQNLEFHHPRVFLLPIGIANAMWEHGNPLRWAEAAVPTHDWADRPITLLRTHYSPTHPDRAAFTALKRGDITDVGGISPADFPALLRRAKFVLCPRGNGIDTHRFWETLVCGAVPVVVENEWARQVQRVLGNVPMLEVPARDLDSFVLPSCVPNLDSWDRAPLFLDYWRANFAPR